MAVTWSKTSEYGKNFAARCARGLIVHVQSEGGLNVKVFYSLDTAERTQQHPQAPQALTFVPC